MTEWPHGERTTGLIALEAFVVAHFGTGNKAVGLERWDTGNKTLTEILVLKMKRSTVKNLSTGFWAKTATTSSLKI